MPKIKILMKKTLNSLIIILCVLVGITSFSCAHKSGHRNSSRNTSTSVSQNGGQQRQSPQQKESSLVTNKRSDKKLEGQEVFDKYATAVFMVFTSDGFNDYQGSGFFINGNGLAVSNYHVFKGTGKGMENIKLLGQDNPYKVTEVIAQSDEEDFILFRVNCTNTNYLPIATSKPKIGEKVFAIGSPRGLENTFSSGEVSQWRDENLMQISALIDHGSSGGALINEYGEVVGITSGSFADGSQANLNYAWSIDAVKPYLK